MSSKDSSPIDRLLFQTLERSAPLSYFLICSATDLHLDTYTGNGRMNDGGLPQIISTADSASSSRQALLLYFLIFVAGHMSLLLFVNVIAINA